MPIKIGNTTVKLPDSIAKVMVGSTLVYQKQAAVPSTFNFTVQMSAGETLVIPAAGTNNFTIKWGDGNQETVNYASPSHAYTAAGSYVVSITGQMTKFGFNNGVNASNVLSFNYLGGVGLTDVTKFAYGCVNCTYINIASLDTAVTSLNGFARGCSSLASLDVTGLDTRYVSSFTSFANGCSSLPDIVGLETLNVESAGYFTSFLYGVTLPTLRYDAVLINWGAQNMSGSGATIDFGGSKYTAGGAAEAGRSAIVANGFNITDGGVAV